jgi:hypothetical protein
VASLPGVPVPALYESPSATYQYGRICCRLDVTVHQIVWSPNGAQCWLAPEAVRGSAAIQIHPGGPVSWKSNRMKSLGRLSRATGRLPSLRAEPKTS